MFKCSANSLAKNQNTLNRRRQITVQLRDKRPTDTQNTRTFSALTQNR